ncbi:MAG: hypothetical protein AAF719_03705 [Pseudomonadota bacterium]
MKNIALSLILAGFAASAAYAQDAGGTSGSSNFNFAIPDEAEEAKEAAQSYGGFNFKLPGEADEAMPVGLGSAPLPDDGATPLPSLEGDAPNVDAGASN